MAENLPGSASGRPVRPVGALPAVPAQLLLAPPQVLLPGAEQLLVLLSGPPVELGQELRVVVGRRPAGPAEQPARRLVGAAGAGRPRRPARGPERGPPRRRHP